jgi:predicted amidohydrolase YtcJ
MNFQRIVVFAVFFLLAACDQSSTIDYNDTVSNTMSQADAIYHNAKVYTVNDNDPWAEAVAIKGDEIIFVGSDHGALALKGDDTKVTDLQGQMLLPGFIDSHSHPVAGGAYAFALALDTYARPDVWVQAIAAYADANEDLPVILAMVSWSRLLTTAPPNQ